ncbi:hypothetical protein M9H77_06778 [Catharanthus roseus]|uniref:Uncharacterized protein n=1 Tax=Catharanthus roseus TaxID=4058 RepID=A0ACC0BTA2_CATRO|nr:hypothetical protein M9H77_06778 [Catharanthus roseus]
MLRSQDRDGSMILALRLHLEEMDAFRNLHVLGGHFQKPLKHPSTPKMKPPQGYCLFKKPESNIDNVALRDNSIRQINKPSNCLLACFCWELISKASEAPNTLKMKPPQGYCLFKKPESNIDNVALRDNSIRQINKPSNCLLACFCWELAFVGRSFSKASEAPSTPKMKPPQGYCLFKSQNQTLIMSCSEPIGTRA